MSQMNNGNEIPVNPTINANSAFCGENLNFRNNSFDRFDRVEEQLDFHISLPRQTTNSQIKRFSHNSD